MHKSFEKKYHRLENKNWWFVSRREMILQLIKKSGIKKNANILEIGCSGGPLIMILTAAGFFNVTGIDLSKDAIKVCRKNGIKKVSVMDGAKTSFKSNTFDLIIASDILEHIKDDKSALSEWRRILKPKGKLILFVPAFNALWSSHDDSNNHYRRYDKSQLNNRLKKSNYKLSRISYWNFLLFFPAYLHRRFQRSAGVDQLYELNPLINGILIIVLKAENFILNYVDFPVGVSIFTVCVK